MKDEKRIQMALTGMPKENLEIIIEFNHREELSERYLNEMKDYGFENAKRRFSAGHMGGDENFKVDPIDQLPDKGPDVHELAFPEKKIENPLLKNLEAAMKELTPEQMNLIYDIYNIGITPSEIAKRDGVSRQAVYNRQMKIIKKLRKLMETQETTW